MRTSMRRLPAGITRSQSAVGWMMAPLIFGPRAHPSAPARMIIRLLSTWRGGPAPGVCSVIRYSVPISVVCAVSMARPLSRADRFDVVAVGIEQEGGVISGAIVGAQTGAAVIAAASLEAGGVEAIDGGAIEGAERDVRTRTRRAWLI